VPAISTNDLKNGVSLNIDNTLYTVVEFQHVKPGKGGAFVRTKLRNLRTGNMLERTFNAGIKVEQAILDKRDMQFLYKDGDDYVFMDNVTYDQLTIKPVALGDAADYLIENAIAMIARDRKSVV
jgi:elongation factor P